MPTAKPTNILFYGKGVFSTIAFRDRDPLLWEKHWKRLVANADKVGLDVGRFSESSVWRAVETAIIEFGPSRGRVRVTFFDESIAPLWGGSGTNETSLHVIAGEAHIRPEKLRLTVSPHRVNSTSPLAGVKSCNYLGKLISLEHARSNGYEEAIRLNERGEIVSACMANVFWVKGKQLFTPSLRTGCLPGTTRDYVLENLGCLEVERGINELREADDIFLTSAGLGVVPVTEFEGRRLKMSGHPITELLPF